MSLPVTRRIARAALLVAAGAAPVVAAAGSAEAAAPKAPDLGGVTALDSAAKTGVGVVNELGKQTATTVAPALAKAAGTVAAKAAPLSQAGAHNAERMARGVAKKGMSTNAMAPEAARGALSHAHGLIGGMPIG
ncbi:ATP-binding protein [Streptomyces sp. NPDC053427]|uniref:ATP-binding protein n=1 Tax=Streptomyces sp. NPDC053427 TaxID=3365701 RepID=UPI0037D8CE0E